MKVTLLIDTEFYRHRFSKETNSIGSNLKPYLDWREGITPYSRRFRDVYFSSQNGLEETRHVFLNGTGLPQLWLNRKLFVVMETGFGTGLNFLATWKLWRETTHPDARLHFLSVEAYPLTPPQISKAISPWPELAVLVKQLQKVYPKIHNGFHRIWLDGGRVILTLLIGEAYQVLSETEAEADVWFLDGFSPARNPDMWSTRVFGEIARLSKRGARIATFSSAGVVKQGLSKVGFEIEKRPGFHRKREMMTGHFNGPVRQSYIPPWYRIPSPLNRSDQVAIIGAGVAGCAVAGALNKRGRSVVLIDRQHEIGTEASGNSAAIVAPQLSLISNVPSTFYDRAYRTALQSIDEADRQLWGAKGILQIFKDGSANKRVKSMNDRSSLWKGAAFHVGPALATEYCGLKIESDGAWFSDAGVVIPGDFVELLAGSTVFLRDCSAADIRKNNSFWRILDERKNVIFKSEALVLAAGLGSASFQHLSILPLNGVLGQISLLPETEKSRSLKSTIICGGYLIPSLKRKHFLGATYSRRGFNLNDWPQAVTFDGHRKNKNLLPPYISAILSEPSKNSWDGRSAVRCSTPDRLPAVGPVAIREDFVTDFRSLIHGPRGQFPLRPQFHDGLFALTGLGSRGFVTAALCAEILVSQMLGEPWPVERRVVLGLAPSRFLVRQMGRKNMT